MIPCGFLVIGTSSWVGPKILAIWPATIVARAMGMDIAVTASGQNDAQVVESVRPTDC